MKLYERYQDYVIKDGKLVGEFEQMYKDYEDPWEQTTRETCRSEKAIALNLIKKYRFSNIVELDCGLGHFSKQISDLGVTLTAVDISETAVQKAKKLYPQCTFVVADILEFDKYYTHDTDCIIMSEITWYVLDKLDVFIESLKNKAKERTVAPNASSSSPGQGGIYLIHLLSTYPEGVQKYGADKFTNLKEILAYFSLDYEEYGECIYKDLDLTPRTYFLAKII